MQLNKYYAQYKPLRKKSHHTEPSFSLKNFLKNFTLRALSNEEKNTPCDVSEVKNIGLSNRESFFLFSSHSKKKSTFLLGTWAVNPDNLWHFNSKNPIIRAILSYFETKLTLHFG